jgi:hypothetical protein
VFDVSLFSLFTICKFLLGTANFKYLYSIINLRLTRDSRFYKSLAVLVPFFLTVIISAVLWSYEIYTAPNSSSRDDMIVHLESSKNHSLPSPPQASSVPSLSQDVYLVSSYHFMCAPPCCDAPAPHSSLSLSTLSAIASACCIVKALYSAAWRGHQRCAAICRSTGVAELGHLFFIHCSSCKLR